MTSEHITKSNYHEVNQAIQVGDVIAFGGNSLFSKWAKLTTNSHVTHTAVVVETAPIAYQNQACTIQVAESTVFNGQSGVMVNSLSERVETYDGEIWWLPLSDQSRIKLEQNKSVFFDFLHQQKGKDYDIWQLFGSTVDATDDMPFLHRFSRNYEDYSSWFCSELIAAAFKATGVINKVNASEVTPIDLCQFNIYAKQYVQFKGAQKNIAGINSLIPDGWGHHWDADLANNDPDN